MGDRKKIHLNLFPSLEAQVASLSDDIAYCAHDIADGHEAGILSFTNLKNSPFFGELLVLEKPFEDSASLSVAYGCRKLIRYLVNDLICHSHKNIENQKDKGGRGPMGPKGLSSLLFLFGFRCFSSFS